MKKKILLLVLFCLIFPYTSADNISNYVIRDSVPLGQTLTIKGDYNADNKADVLCAFIIFDTNSPAKAMKRLTDQYTFSDGFFYTEFLVNEPLLKRGIDYNVITKCGTAQADAIFTVGQVETIEETAYQWWLYMWLPENILTVAVVFILFLLMFWIIMRAREQIIAKRR